MEVKSSGLLLPMDLRECKEGLLFRRRVYENERGEQKLIISQEENIAIQTLEPTKFLDLQYGGELSRQCMVDFFEGVLMGRPGGPNLGTVALESELYPKTFFREYVNSTVSIE